jgi:hypothetical protein
VALSFIGGHSYPPRGLGPLWHSARFVVRKMGYSGGR